MPNFLKNLFFFAACLLAGALLAMAVRYFRRPPAPALPGTTPPMMRGMMEGSGGAWAERYRRIRDLNGNWVAISFGLTPDRRPSVEEGAIQEARRQGLKIALLWRHDAGTAPAAQRLDAAATLAEQYHADLLALGAEDPDNESLEEAWRETIRQARQRYHGPVAFVSTPDMYQGVAWWNQVDYIAIAGGFPLSGRTDPAAHDLETGWQAHLGNMESISRREGKPIVLLDLAYPATAGAAHHPEGAAGEPDPALQQACYEATLRATRGRTWLAGVFLNASQFPDSAAPTARRIWSER